MNPNARIRAFILQLFEQVMPLRIATIASGQTKSPAVLDARVTAQTKILVFPLSTGEDNLGSWSASDQAAGTFKVQVQTSAKTVAGTDFLCILFNAPQATIL